MINYTQKNMNRIHNNIVEYYLENEMKSINRGIKNNTQIQFYLYEHLLDRYFKFLNKNGYDNESDFLREMYCDYVNKK